MSRKRFSVEQIINQLREAEVLLAQGKTVGEICRRIGVSEQSYYRWHREYGWIKVDQARDLPPGCHLYFHHPWGRSIRWRFAMPFRDLRTSDNQIDPLAPFIVLAIMCHPLPDEVAQRDQMLSTLRHQTGEGKVRRAVLSTEEYLNNTSRHAARGGIAGSLFLTYLQLSASGKRASLNAAISIVRCHPPRWSDHIWPVWDAKAVNKHMPHSRRKMLEAFHHYLPAAHLWAARLHGYQNERNDVSPESLSMLPTFLAYADSFLQLAHQTPWAGVDRKVLLPGPMAWRFGLPARFAQNVSLKLAPISTPPTRR